MRRKSCDVHPMLQKEKDLKMNTPSELGGSSPRSQVAMGGRKAGFKIMGLDPSPELIAISMGEFKIIVMGRAIACLGQHMPPICAFLNGFCLFKRCGVAVCCPPAHVHLTPPLSHMGTPPTPCTAVYFTQGVLGLSRLALSFFFKDTLHIEPAQVWCSRGPQWGDVGGGMVRRVRGCRRGRG